ncbi:hypothetical protein PanWU01x14_003410 [Parasponia andersonii]|uniref:Uncharacterized protein n=1 Tax=Parasponia andersonii TaxID=3476 RepID=A0A2P5E5F8_PARAD|nr:hypothetical protein PanWU01x14_003410 [Parasponia andersonii]
MALFVNEEEDFELLEMAEGEELDFDLEFSHWEFVSASDLDSEESKEEEQNADADDLGDLDNENEGNGSGSSSFGDRIEARGVHFLHRVDDGYHGYGDGDGDDDDEGFDDHGDGFDEDEDDDDDEGLYGLNDELVPWSVSDKFGGRQRMRKLGKRGFTKMFNSKRSPYLFVRPGVVRGKHGLGLKHSL